MRTELWIDGDIYAYRAAAAVEEEINWGDDIWSLVSDLSEAKKILQQQVSKWLESYPNAHLIWCFSDYKNFRKEVYPAYKSNRKGKRKPTGYKALVDWVGEQWETKRLPWCEADDVLGVFCTEPVEGTRRICVTEDKDLRTVPCKILQGGHLISVWEAGADWHFCLQTLTGDSTDGYPGCPKVGKVSASKLLMKSKHDSEGFHQWSTVVAAFEKAGLTEEDAITQARCARILRWGEYDFENEEVRLWSPREEAVEA